MNHPSIAAIYGIQEAEGTRALELVDGPTLADPIAKGPIRLWLVYRCRRVTCARCDGRPRNELVP